MVKFLKPGKVVIVLAGRYAGRKAVIVKNYDEGTKKFPFAHAIVAGINRYPRRVVKSMSRKKVNLRSRMKTFVKVFNYSHLMPTRYALDIELGTSVSGLQSISAAKRVATRRKVRTSFDRRYKAGKNRWFFTKLRF
eukprot:TRINITY_DN9964_c0_g1_i1.p1 TRINITY_DN9964_c0_g1~~TRINITY_DN9964_c0_g1_i1.p1  ORF type:complete len:136 (-),score=42.44 TRINITY_DN9964_c0_g1_i1:12-419(-)